MMKRMTYSILLITAFFLSACTNSEQNMEAIIPDVIEVDIDIPETSSPNEKLAIPVHVSQGDEPVDDARDVVIEIWESEDRENGFLEEAKLQSDGLYQIDYTFSEDGIFLVQAHVSARDMHSMPIQPIFVGDVSEDEINAFNEAGGVASEQQGESKHH